MASKSTKKDNPSQKDMATVARLIQELKSDLTTEFRMAIGSLETKLDNIQVTVADHGQRLTSLEDGLNGYSDRWEEMEARCTLLEQGYSKLQSKLVDIELRGRRNNIRIVGLDESIGPGVGEHPTDFFAGLLAEILGKGVLPTAPELDRCHRALTAKPAPGSRPRAIIARVHFYRVKEAIIREARKKRGALFYKGKPVAIFEDYCPEVMEQRAAYREVMAELYQRGFKPSLLYPHRLFIRSKDGERKRLTSPKEARDFLKSQRSEGPA